MISESISPGSQVSSPDNDPRSSEETRTPPGKRRNIHVMNQIPRSRKFARNVRKQKQLPRKAIPLPNIDHINQLQMEDEDEMFFDDDEGHLNFNIGDTIGQYALLGFLGKGTFGRVAKARQAPLSKIVALKITRNLEDSRESAGGEIRILKKLREVDPDGKNLWIQMLDYFDFQGHVCIAFEKLGDSLYTFMKENKFQPFQLSQIRHIAYQICYSINALHDNLIIHTDLKPENICFITSEFTYGIRPTRQQTYRKPTSTNIKVIDFGSAVDFFVEQNFMIQTRYYRAPEVVFDLQWNQAVDVWSIGCILFELYTGECLFAAQDDDDHYHILQEVLGPLPKLYHSTHLAIKHKQQISPEPPKKSRCKPLRKYMQMPTKEHEKLFDLIEKMLDYDPKERMSLSTALGHPFFSLLPDNLKIKH